VYVAAESSSSSSSSSSVLAMGKAGRWLKSFLSGKKDRPPPHADATAAAAAPSPASGPPPPKDKRWSFRRAAQEGKAAEATPDVEFDQKKHAVAVAVATAAAADAAVAAAHAAAAVARLSSRRAYLAEDAAAVRIQATFRGYLVLLTHTCAARNSRIFFYYFWIMWHDRMDS
jgi:hypothetical protein